MFSKQFHIIINVCKKTIKQSMQMQKLVDVNAYSIFRALINSYITIFSHKIIYIAIYQYIGLTTKFLFIKVSTLNLIIKTNYLCSESKKQQINVYIYSRLRSRRPEDKNLSMTKGPNIITLYFFIKFIPRKALLKIIKYKHVKPSRLITIYDCSKTINY